MDPTPVNPYASPIADAAPPTLGADAELEAIRRKHLTAETNIKGIGALAILGAVMQVLAGVGTIGRAPIEAAILLASGVVLFVCGIWLRNLQPIGRLVYSCLMALSCTGMLVGLVTGPGAPEQTTTATVVLLFSALFMWLLWNAKAKVVFSQHYREVVIRATPYVKYKSSILSILVLVLLVLGLIVALAVAVSS